MSDLAKLKICFITGTLGQGGAEQQLFYILKTLKDAGSKVALLSLTRDEFWEKRIKDLGIPVTWVGQRPSRLARFKKVFDEVKAIRPDVFQAQHFYANLYVSIVSRALGIKGVGAMRNDGTSEMRDLGALMGRLSLHMPQIIAANSLAGIQNAKNWGIPESRLKLLRNVVDIDRFRPEPGADDGVVRILAIGRLSNQKRMDRFLRLIAMIKPRLERPVKALIVGDGPDRRRLEAQARESLIGDLVEFRGRIIDPREAYREAELLALTSDWEGTPNVILEAMACGLPVIATKAGDTPAIVQHGVTGFLADPEDEEALAEAMLKLINNEAQRKQFGYRAREHIVANYSLRLLPRQLENFYRVVNQ